MRVDERNENWFAVESKSYELTMEGKGKKTRCFITERSRGVASWIRFGVEGMEKLLWGVEEFCRVPVPAWRTLVWRENGRSFRLESRVNNAGRFLLCSVTDGEGKKHWLVFPEGRGLVNGWSMLAGKIRGLGFKPRQEMIPRRSVTSDPPSRGEKCISFRKNIVTCEGESALKEVGEGGSSVINAAWVDVGDCSNGQVLGPLQFCLIGRWKIKPAPYPRSEELETWFRAVWRLNEKVRIMGLNEDLLFLEFNSPEQAKRVLESGRKSFKGGVLQLDWWSPETGCLRSRGVEQEAWIRVVGLPLHLWSLEILRRIGDVCGGFVDIDKETVLRKELKWARLLVKTEGKVRPSTVNILEGPRLYELQIWWEILPWVTGVYPVASRVAEKFQEEEDEVLARAARRVSLLSPSCNDDGLWEQRSGSEKVIGVGQVGAGDASFVSGASNNSRNGVHEEGGRIKWAGVGRQSDALVQHIGRADGPRTKVSGALNPGPMSIGPTGQQKISGLLTGLLLKQNERPTAGTGDSGGLMGLVPNGLKRSGPQTVPRLLKSGGQGLRETERAVKVACGSKGGTYVSTATKRLGDGDSSLGVVSSLVSPADPAWICARDPLRNAQENNFCLRETSGFESWWEKGLRPESSICPLMGFRHQYQFEEGCPDARSLALLVAETRGPEEDDPETSRLLAKVSRFVTVSSHDCSPSTISVFGRPLLPGGSSGVGESHELEDLGGTEPLRVVMADGSEWGKGLTVVPMEGGLSAEGPGPLSEEPTVEEPEFRGYNSWEDSCLIKFSEFLGVKTVGFEEEILELLRKMEFRQHGIERKGDPAVTRCERELRKLECTINYNGKGLIRGGRDMGDFLLKLK